MNHVQLLCLLPTVSQSIFSRSSLHNRLHRYLCNILLKVQVTHNTSISCKVAALLGYEYQSRLESAIEWKGKILSYYMLCCIYTCIYLCHLNTLHQRPACYCIVYKALLAGTCKSARRLTRESFDRYKVARKR